MQHFFCKIIVPFAVIFFTQNLFSLIVPFAEKKISMEELEVQQYKDSPLWPVYQRTIRDITEKPETRYKNFETLVNLAKKNTFPPAQCYLGFLYRGNSMRFRQDNLSQNERKSCNDAAEENFKKAFESGHQGVALNLAQWYLSRKKNIPMAAALFFDALQPRVIDTDKRLIKEAYDWFDILLKNTSSDTNLFFSKLMNVCKERVSEGQGEFVLQQLSHLSAHNLLEYGHYMSTCKGMHRGLRSIQKAIALDNSLKKSENEWYLITYPNVPSQEMADPFHLYHTFLMAENYSLCTENIERRLCSLVSQKIEKRNQAFFKELYDNSLYNYFCKQNGLSAQRALFLADFEGVALQKGWSVDGGDNALDFLARSGNGVATDTLVFNKLMNLGELITRDNRNDIVCQLSKKYLTPEAQRLFYGEQLKQSLERPESYWSIVPTLWAHYGCNPDNNEDENFLRSLLQEAHSRNNNSLYISVAKRFLACASDRDERIRCLERLGELNVLGEDDKGTLLVHYLRRGKSGDYEKAVKILPLIARATLKVEDEVYFLIKEKALIHKETYAAFLIAVFICSKANSVETNEEILQAYDVVEQDTTLEKTALSYLNARVIEGCQNNLALSLKFLDKCVRDQNRELGALFLKVIEHHLIVYFDEKLIIEQHAKERDFLESLLSKINFECEAKDTINLLLVWYKSLEENLPLSDFTPLIDKLLKSDRNYNGTVVEPIFKNLGKEAMRLFVKNANYQKVLECLEKFNLKEELLGGEMPDWFLNFLFKQLSIEQSVFALKDTKKYRECLVGKVKEIDPSLVSAIEAFYSRKFGQAYSALKSKKEELAVGYRALIPVEHNSNWLEDARDYLKRAQSNDDKHHMYLIESRIIETLKHEAFKPLHLTTFFEKSILSGRISAFEILLHYYLGLHSGTVQALVREETDGASLHTFLSTLNAQVVMFYALWGVEPSFQKEIQERLVPLVRRSIERIKSEGGLVDMEQFKNLLEKKHTMEYIVADSFYHKAIVPGISRDEKKIYLQMALQSNPLHYPARLSLAFMHTDLKCLNDFEKLAQEDLSFSANPDWEKKQLILKKCLGELFLKGNFGIYESYVQWEKIRSCEEQEALKKQIQNIPKAVKYLKEIVKPGIYDKQVATGLTGAFVWLSKNNHDIEPHLAELSQPTQSIMRLKMALLLKEEKFLKTEEEQKYFAVMCEPDSQKTSEQLYSIIADNLFRHIDLTIFNEQVIDFIVKAHATKENPVFTFYKKEIFKTLYNMIEDLYLTDAKEIFLLRDREKNIKEYVNKYACEKIFEGDKEYALLMFSYFDSIQKIYPIEEIKQELLRYARCASTHSESDKSLYPLLNLFAFEKEDKYIELLPRIFEVVERTDHVDKQLILKYFKSLLKKRKSEKDPVVKQQIDCFIKKIDELFERNYKKSKITHEEVIKMLSKMCETMHKSIKESNSL